MSGKIEIPEHLKSDLPQTQWGKILGMTPIVMTVIATALAGLASSEMTKAQYDRSLAAQLQSKAGDQWSYYQAKKLRSAVARNSLDLLLAATEINPTGALALEKSTDTATAAALIHATLPDVATAKFDENVQAAVDAVENSRPESEITAALGKVKPETLAASLRAAQDAALAFDDATTSINKAVDKLDDTMMKSSDRVAVAYFAAARLRYTAARYDADSRFNLAVGAIYELQVRQSNYSAEKHHERSGKFFFGMLAAQVAVIVSTFAIAARQRSFLWSVAAAAGAAAVAFSVYVYLYV